MEHGTIPTRFKLAYITPILKKPGLDPTEFIPTDFKFSVLSKLLERIVNKQLGCYLERNNLLPSLQSAYRENHSTETAVLKVINDILLSLDSGKLVGSTGLISHVRKR